MQRTNRHQLLTVILLLVALVGASCAGDSSDDSGSDTTVADAGSDTTVADAGSDDQAVGGEISISYLQKLDDLDPLNANNPAAQGIAEGLFDTLTRIADDGSVAPWLAESWEVSDDQLTMTMHLREGVTFSDGTPLDADAVIFTMDLFQDPAKYFGTTVYSMTAWEAVDASTIVLTLAYPDSTVPAVLSQPETSIVSPTAYQELGIDGFAINPVGSGPYLLESWEPGVEVVMTKNADYWQDGVGLAERIVWKNFADGAAAVLSAQSGGIDLLQEQEPKDVPLFEGIEGWKVGVYEGGYYGLLLNTAIPPFDKPENREALTYAIDALAIANVAFEGYATPGAGVLSPASSAYDSSVTPITRDPAKVAELLTAAGNPDGFTFKISVTPQPFRAQVLEIVKAGLAETGIVMEVEVNQFARHIEILQVDFAGAEAAFVVQQSLPVVTEQSLYVYFGCDAYLGYSGYCDPEDPTYDELAWGASAEPDPTKRVSLIQQANQMLITDQPMVNLVFQQNIYAWDEALLGDYTPTYLGGYNYLYLQPKG